jgi:hypothetical protein
MLIHHCSPPAHVFGNVESKLKPEAIAELDRIDLRMDQLQIRASRTLNLMTVAQHQSPLIIRPRRHIHTLWFSVLCRFGLPIHLVSLFISGELELDPVIDS